MLFTLDRVKIKDKSVSIENRHLPALPWPPKIFLQFSQTCQNYDSMCREKCLKKLILTEAFNSRIKKRNGPGRYKK